MVASNGIPSGGSGGFSVPLIVAKGGSGQTTLTAHALLVGNGTTGILALAPSTARNVAISDGTDWASRALQAADIPALSYVTSVALALPAIFTVSGSPVTASGTLTGTLATQTANQIWAGPTTGVAAAPTFRALVAADIPTLTLAKISDAGTMAAQNANSVAITGGAIDGATVGATTASTGAFSTAYVGATGGPAATELTVVTTSASDPRGIMSAQYSTDTLASRIHLRKARGTPAVPTTIVTGDLLGRVRFSGYDGSNFLQMASIDAVSTGTVASTRIPTYLAFSVATDAAPSVLTEVARLTVTGLNNTVIGATTAAAVTGTTITASTKIIASRIEPGSDSTTAIILGKAAGGASVVTLDTTNSFVGIGTTPTELLDILGSTNAVLKLRLKNNNSGSSAYTSFQLHNSTPGIGAFFKNSAANTAYGGASSFNMIQAEAANLTLGTADTVRTTISSIGVLTQVATDAATAAVTAVAIFDHTGGTTAAGFGTSALWKGKSSSQSRELVDLQGLYNNPTDASYTTYGLIRAYYMSAGTPTARNAIGWGATGSAALIGFLAVAAAPVALQTTYTQTYTTTTSTVNPASTSAFTGQDNLQVGSVYAKVADLNTLRGDVLMAMQLLNQLIDNDQAYGLAG